MHDRSFCGSDENDGSQGDEINRAPLVSGKKLERYRLLRPNIVETQPKNVHYMYSLSCYVQPVRKRFNVIETPWIIVASGCS